MVENATNTTANRKISIFFASTSAAGMLSSYFGGFIQEKTSIKFVFVIAIFIPLMLILPAIITKEKRQVERPQRVSTSFRARGKTVWRFVKQKFIYWPLLFVFLIVLTPSLDTVMFFYLTGVQKFTPGEMGTISTLCSASNVLGIIFYSVFLHKFGFKTVIIVSTILFSLANSLKLLLVLGYVD